MEVSNITSYRNRHKPQSYRVAVAAQERRLQVVRDKPVIDLHKWRGLEQDLKDQQRMEVR